MNTTLPKCHYRISVKALIYDESGKKFMLLLEKSGKWELPGGGLDWGEGPVDGLRREISEEMDLTVLSVNKNPSYFFTFEHPRGPAANVVYEAKVANYNFVPSDECVDMKFFSPEEIATLDALPNVRKFAEIFTAK